MQIAAWVVEAPHRPMVRATREEDPGPGDVLVETAGCGVCHTDLGFFYDGVPDPAPVSPDARPRNQRHASSPPVRAPASGSAARSSSRP